MPANPSCNGSRHHLVSLQGHRGILAPRQDVDGVQLLKDGLVLQRRVGPRELAASGHGSLPHLGGLLLVRVDLNALLQNLRHQLHGARVQLLLHGHSASKVDARDHVLDRVHQAARLRDHRQRTEAHGLQLREATRLPARGHEVVVCTRNHGVALSAAPAGQVDLLRELLRKRLAARHKVRAAGADDDELQVHILQHSGQGRQEVVVALLQVHAANKDAQRRLRGHGQAIHLLQLRLQLRLLLIHILHAEGRRHLRLLRESRIHRRHRLLHAVHNTRDALRHEDVIKLAAHLRQVDDLPRIRRRHRQDAVHVLRSATHPVDAALHLRLCATHLDRHVEGEGAHDRLRQAVHLRIRLLRIIPVETALEDRVVDQQATLRVGPVLGAGLLHHRQVDRHHSAVPIVHHNDAVATVGEAA
mmetsp:Transcript_19516/g.49951  ORF Transcript_19516/g.49951 Transcript_19516/m.49951 type:complete len:416 (-) Transcript_19516:1285-2532(-)